VVHELAPQGHVVAERMGRSQDGVDLALGVRPCASNCDSVRRALADSSGGLSTFGAAEGAAFSACRFVYPAARAIRFCSST
jgi:hypothetical protein